MELQLWKTAPKSGPADIFLHLLKRYPPPHVLFANRLDLVQGPSPLLMSQNEVLSGIGQSQGPILIGGHWFVAGLPTRFCLMGNSRKQM